MAVELCVDNDFLISLVKQQPVLWDRTLETYKNRFATQEAWKEIMKVIHPGYEKREERIKRALAKKVINRWTHIRDNYTRSFKKIREQNRLGISTKTTKLYVYHKQLSFLQRVLQRQECTRIVVEDNNSNSESLDNNAMDTSENIIKMPTPIQIIKRPSISNDVDTGDMKKIKTTDSCSNNEQITNRHLSFFYGILPTLDNFDDDEVLEFQMGVLQLLKTIKNNRQQYETTTFGDIYYAGSSGVKQEK